MAFLALVLALLIEHVRPLARGNAVHALFSNLAASVRRAIDGGERTQGTLGWAIVILGSAAMVLLAEWLAESLHPLFVFALHVFVLYCTIGFRQFSLAFAEIQVALAADDPEGAGRLVDDWIDGDDFDNRPAAARASAADGGYPDAQTSEASVAGAGADPDFAGPRSSLARRSRRRRSSIPVSTLETETSRRAIAYALLAAHRHVLGPLFAYILIPGAVGPVIYRLAAMLARAWASAPLSRWGDFAELAFAVIDWLPARLSAAGFAVVGNFEDAIYCWRGVSSNRAASLDSRSLLLAAGGGALRVRVAEPTLEGRWAQAEPGFECPGSEAHPANLGAAAGLVWRSLVLWLALFALITVSAWMGR
jgi:adenosylcobinamide-phosphate synthase